MSKDIATIGLDRYLELLKYEEAFNKAEGIRTSWGDIKIISRDETVELLAKDVETLRNKVTGLLREEGAGKANLLDLFSTIGRFKFLFFKNILIEELKNVE